MKDWIHKTVSEARKIFGVGPEWSVSIKQTDKPGGSEWYGGYVHVDSAYLNADMELMEDIKEDDKGRRTIYHEVAHIGHGEVNRIAYLAFDELSEEQRKIFKELYQDAVERYCQRIARSLVAYFYTED